MAPEKFLTLRNKEKLPPPIGNRTTICRLFRSWPGHYKKYNNSVSTTSEAVAVFFPHKTSLTKYDTAWLSDQKDQCRWVGLCDTRKKNEVCNAGSMCVMKEMLRTSVILLYDVGLCCV